MLIAVSDIRYLRAELKYVTVRTAAREHLVEESLSRLEQEFADQVRAHPSQLPGGEGAHRRLRKGFHGGGRIALDRDAERSGRETAGQPTPTAHRQGTRTKV